MNNKILNIISFIAAFFTLVGCSDQFLEDKKLYNSFTNESVFSSEAQTNRYLAYMYYNIYNGHTSPVQALWGAWSDDKTKMTEEIGGSIGDLINSTKTLGTSDDASKYYGGRLTESPGNNPYTRIRDCNTIVENMDKYGRGKLSESFIQGVRGQAFFLRAMQYFDLMRTYGGVPLVTKVQNGVSQDESIKLPRASTKEVLIQICADLDSAANNLPSNWASEGTDYGRPTKGAALAMKSRVLLTGASPLFNKNWDDPNDPLWKAALDAGLAAKAELDNAGYKGINPTGIDSTNGKLAMDWAKMFYNYNNKKNPEAIFTILTDVGTLGNNLLNNWQSSIRLASQKGGGGIPAPKEMIDLFPMKDGKRPTAANGYDQFLFFRNRDPRFYRTFAFSGYKMPHKSTASSAAAGTVWAYNYVSIKTTGSGASLKRDTVYNYSDNNSLISPAFVCKMFYPQVDSTQYNYSGVDIIDYRYGELLLNIAECYAATNQISDCLDYLGKVRARVGIPATNNYGIGNLTDKYEAIEACLYERRIELAYEGKRFWDIQRWMLYNDDEVAGNNTCAKLRLNTINGTCRTGSYLMTLDTVRFTAPVTVAGDPYIVQRIGITFNPDLSLPESRIQLNQLANFYKSHFKIAPLKPNQAMDKINSLPAFIDWKQNYYIQGLHSEVLNYNPWLKQTQGWTDYFGAPGTFNYRE